jgi:hypothetical protein
VYRFVSRLVRDQISAEELIGEVFSKSGAGGEFQDACGKLHRLLASEPFEAAGCIGARHLAADVSHTSGCHPVLR